jgi:hypothetical protein
MKNYTVVLLVPEYMCVEAAYGQEIYVSLTRGDSTVEAIDRAKDEAYAAHMSDRPEVMPESPKDYKLCVMFEGHHDVALFGWQAH